MPLNCLIHSDVLSSSPPWHPTVSTGCSFPISKPKLRNRPDTVPPESAGRNCSMTMKCTILWKRWVYGWKLILMVILCSEIKKTDILFPVCHSIFLSKEGWFSQANSLWLRSAFAFGCGPCAQEKQMSGGFLQCRPLLSGLLL